MAPLPLDTRFQGSMRRQASGSGFSGVYLAGLFGLWGAHLQDALGAHPRLYALRADSGPRRERGAKHPMARTAPSGSPYVGGGDEPRTRGALAPAECQDLSEWSRPVPNPPGLASLGMPLSRPLACDWPLPLSKACASERDKRRDVCEAAASRKGAVRDELYAHLAAS